jgi:hypothetical protein
LAYESSINPKGGNLYAELNLSLAAAVLPASISKSLASHFGKSAINPAFALANRPIAGYSNLAVGAAAFPTGVVVVYLCTASDEVLVHVYGKTIPQLKEHCAKAVKQLKKDKVVKITHSNASILVPINGTDVDLLAGIEKSWFGSFWDALIDKSISKLVTAVINAWLAYTYFQSLSTPLLSALIGVGATAIGVVIEAAYAAWLSESWCWKESK